MSMNTTKSGFTLIEVMVAILILAIGILAWALLQDNNIEGRSKSSRMTTAIELAQSVMEANASNVTKWTDTHDAANGTLNSTMDNVIYSLDWSVEKDGSNADLFSGGRAFWKISVDNRWEHYGQHRVNFERVVIGK